MQYGHVAKGKRSTGGPLPATLALKISEVSEWQLDG